MKRIGLISDTHHYLDNAVFHHLDKCDEIWHAGDFGSAAVADALQKLRPLRGVYGNIDGQDIRSKFAEVLDFTIEDVKVLMIHIGGYPGKYSPLAKKEILSKQPKIFIAGHSHILKIMYDEKFQCLHINPGAAGNQGWHKVRTLVRFIIDGGNIRDCEVVELGRRGQV
ncbi:MAG: metallophosphatase family protein [Bacteroidota bacterium]|nr:metallophosphatase family protein [Bacteroidota bacterium]